VPVPTEDFPRFASLLGQRACGLFARWEADVLDPLAEQADASRSSRSQEELRQLREAREQAQHKVNACVERKQAAAAALAAAAAEPFEDPDVPDSPEKDEGSARERKDERSHHKGRRGWGRKVKGLFRHHHKSAGDDKDSGAACKGVDDPIQAANDELMESAEELQQASEELDRLTEQCIEMSRSLQRSFSEDEQMHSKGVREALREAALALEEWADDAKAAVPCRPR